jgi:hypothetical protein
MKWDTSGILVNGYVKSAQDSIPGVIVFFATIYGFEPDSVLYPADTDTKSDVVSNIYIISGLKICGALLVLPLMALWHGA